MRAHPAAAGLPLLLAGLLGCAAEGGGCGLPPDLKAAADKAGSGASADQAAARAAAPTTPPPAGWDEKKWYDTSHQTPKYVVGRIVAKYPHTPDGLKQALPQIQAAYPGAQITGSKGDKLSIPGVGLVDVVQAAGEGGKAWQWLPVGGGGTTNAGSSGGGTTRPAGAGGQSVCAPPNRKETLDAVLARPGMAAALGRACRNQTDWTFPDAVIDELRKSDRRWGYWCRRGKCADPSHDVLAYYCGAGAPVDGSQEVAGIDYIVASCYNPGDGANPSLGWGGLEPGAPPSRGWTSRGRF